MGLFNGGFIPKFPFERNNSFGDGPNIIEKFEMLFKDVETEGKKQGYEKAAKEYEKVFIAIETEYKEAKDLILYQKNSYGSETDRLITKLAALEMQHKELKRKVDKKVKNISAKFNISIENVHQSLASGTLFTSPTTLDILDIIYNYKEKKLRKAEQHGYIEAKELYEKKVKRLKTELHKIKQKGMAEIQTLVDMIVELFDAISTEQMKIADLRVLS